MNDVVKILIKYVYCEQYKILSDKDFRDMRFTMRLYTQLYYHNKPNSTIFKLFLRSK